MSFKLTTIKNTRDVRNVKRASSVATTVDYLYEFSVSTGALKAADASTVANQVLFKANETTSAGTTPVSATVVALGDEFIVDSVNNSNAAHNGQRMILNATGDKLNNTGTDAAAGVFMQVDVIGAAADKKILARKVGA
jgi:hypothetical protein